MLSQSSGSVFTALIVEDNAEFSAVLSSMLQENFPKIQIESVLDGERAEEKVAVCEPDVILMDVRLPGINGIALTRNLKQRGVESRILVLSTYDLEEYRHAAIINGAECFLCKGDPFFTESVLSRVKQACLS
ncbi:response regulator [Thiolapillus sp.]